MEVNLNEIWEKTLIQLEEYIARPSFETWLKQIRPVNIQNNTLRLQVPSVFAKDWVQDKCLYKLKEILSKLLNKNVDIDFWIVEKEKQGSTQNIDISTFGESAESSQLNPKYTFDTFVVGNSNRLPHAASLAIVGAPGKAYNPLFIYGGVGLGKTHLMQAIGHSVNVNHKRLKVTYVTTEKFTNELIFGIKEDKIEEFRIKYRNSDVLLIDDVQFIIGKERTQEEFFHTFNTLYELNKQIVVSSDRPPKEFTTIEDRLRSRFGWGLIADIQPPDLETRIAILQKRAEVERISLPQDVFLLIAKKFPSNIRDLEGALTTITAHCEFHNLPITCEVVEDVLKDVVLDKKTKFVSINKIKEVVSHYFNLKISDLSSERRVKNLTIPRQIAMYLCRELTNSSFSNIGDEFGDRDHTTVMHSYEKVQNEIRINPELEKIISELIEIIKIS